VTKKFEEHKAVVGEKVGKAEEALQTLVKTLDDITG